MQLWPEFEARKREHLREALRGENQAPVTGGLDRVHLHHDALPEIDFSQVTLGMECLGHSFATPFFVAGMTAGHEAALEINRCLAAVCERRGWVMGLGSLRRDLFSASKVEDWGSFRESFPRLGLLANLGVTQLKETPRLKLLHLLEVLKPLGLVLHTNALQEALQPEGTPQFAGVIDAIQDLARSIDVPIILKETGCGFSRRTLTKLRGKGIRAIDVSGLGGTHWGRIEGARCAENSIERKLSKTFANWGETTVDSVLWVKEELPNVEVWASGGVRSGLDAAKLLAIGAHRVGYAKPALEAALEGEENLETWMEEQEKGLKLALFCTGSKSPSDIQGKASK